MKEQTLDGALSLAQFNVPLIAPELLATDEDGGPALRIGHCEACGRDAFPAPKVCSHCLSETMSERALPGTGTLYSYSVVHAAPAHWNAPYALGYVDLPDGLRILGQIQAPFDTIRIGERYRLDIGVVGRGADGNPVSSYVFVREAVQ